MNLVGTKVKGFPPRELQFWSTKAGINPPTLYPPKIQGPRQCESFRASNSAEAFVLLYHTHTIHGTGTFTCMKPIKLNHAGKYSIPMEGYDTISPWSLHLHHQHGPILNPAMFGGSFLYYMTSWDSVRINIENFAALILCKRNSRRPEISWVLTRPQNHVFFLNLLAWLKSKVGK